LSDIGDFFTMDPQKLVRENIDEIIKVYRAARQQFVLGVTSAGSTKKVTAKQPKITNLDDLLGDL